VSRTAATQLLPGRYSATVLMTLVGLDIPSQGTESSIDADNQTNVQAGNLYPSGQNSLASRAATDFQLRELRCLEVLTGKH